MARMVSRLLNKAGQREQRDSSGQAQQSQSGAVEDDIVVQEEAASSLQTYQLHHGEGHQELESGAHLRGNTCLCCTRPAAAAQQFCDNINDFHYEQQRLD